MPEILKQTPLNAVHRAAGARMVDFGGWDMPVNYGSQLEEHHAVRNAAGMFDVSHMLAIDLHGDLTRDFLRYALANNVDKLTAPGKALYSCLLKHDGGTLDDLIVYLLGESHFRIVVNASTADKDLAWLRELAANAGMPIELRPRRDLAMIAVQGPNARAHVWQSLPGSRHGSEGLKAFGAVSMDTDIAPCFIARTGYTGEDGFEVMLPGERAAELWLALVESGVRPCGLGARDTLRLEAGMNLYGQDMDETVSPLESGLAWTVDLKSPRDFVGRDALLHKPHQRDLFGLVLTEGGGVLRSHQRVLTGRGTGETTSGSFSPSLQTSIALARLPVTTSIGERVQVEVRSKALAARVVKPPFVRNGKSLVSAN